MRAVALILGFLAYNLILYHLQGWILWLLLELSLCLLASCLPRAEQTFWRDLRSGAVLVAFVALCNLLLAGPEVALLLALRLELALIALFSLAHSLTPSEIAQGIARLLTPLKVFKVDIETVSLVLTLALNMIPLLLGEARTLQQALQLKGVRFSLRNLLRRPQIFVQTYFQSLFQHLTSLEQALLLKGFE